jgi:oligoendopeptidase F
MSTISAGLEPPSVRWDLSALFQGLDDPRIGETWAWAQKEADEFAATYRGKIERQELDARGLLAAIQRLEHLSQQIAKPMNFASLLFAADSSTPAHGAFLQSQMELTSEIRVKLMFFELELQAAPETYISTLLQDPALQTYRHFVAVTRALSPYRLSEPEEIIFEETANTGCRAWVRLFEELTANHVYRYHPPDGGEMQRLSEQEVLDLLRDPDRAVRIAAADTLTAGLKELERVLVYTYNTLLQDKRIEDRLRGFEYPERARHLSNELDAEVVELVVGLCKDHEALVQRYYRVKREIMGLDKLTHVDRYAPLFETVSEIGWDEARQIILEAFGRFSPTMRERAEEFFSKSWIDAEPRPGKSGGAFCNYNTPDTHPVVLLTYLNKVDDVQTLAHELGHGVHGSLSRAQSYFNFHGTLPLAELASVFGEQLVFEALSERASASDRLAMYAEKIEGAFATVFRQASLYRFEQKCHRLRRESGELTAEQFGDIWQAEIQAMFGDSLELGEQHRGWWSYVGHFYFAPFYVYAYAFGELLALALYQMVKEGGQEFAERYVRLLTLGGSLSPDELMATVGVDLRSKAFWQGGFTIIEQMIDEFERLWSAHRA